MKNKGVGHEAQLICVVHAEPQAHVIWYKETTQIGTTEQLSQQVNEIASIVCSIIYIAFRNFHCDNCLFYL